MKQIEDTMRLFKLLTEVIALVVCATLLIASGILMFEAFGRLFQGDVTVAIEDGLFVMILLEMFYVIRSFITYGSINVSIVANVGVIVAVKELIFQLENITLQTAIAFSIVLISLSLVYLAETFSFQRKKKLLGS